MFSRRKFIITNLAVGAMGAIYCGPLSLVKRLLERPLCVTIKTMVPYPMTLQEFEKNQLAFINAAELGALVTVFQSNKKILEVNHIEWFETHGSWKIVFASPSAYDEWNRILVARQLVNDELRVAQGYLTDVNVSYI
jgi:hypothetical protein